MPIVVFTSRYYNYSLESVQKKSKRVTNTIYSCGIRTVTMVTSTSFPGSLLFPSPGAREERPWERGCGNCSSLCLFLHFSARGSQLRNDALGGRHVERGSAPLYIVSLEKAFNLYVFCPGLFSLLREICFAESRESFTLPKGHLQTQTSRN